MNSWISPERNQVLVKGLEIYFGVTPAIENIFEYFWNFDFGRLVQSLEANSGDQVSMALLSNFRYMQGRVDESQALRAQISSDQGRFTLFCILYFGSATETDLQGVVRRIISLSAPQFSQMLSVQMVSSLTPLTNVYGFGMTRPEKRRMAIETLAQIWSKYSHLLGYLTEADSQLVEDVKLTVSYQTVIDQLKMENRELRLELEHLKCRPSFECEVCGSQVEGGETFAEARRNFNRAREN